MKIRLGVIFGGASVEHEVSIITAVQAMNNIDEDKYEIVPIYIDKNRNWYTGNMLREIDVYRDFDNLKKYAKRVFLANVNGKFELRKLNGLFSKTISEIDVAFPIVHGSGVEDGTLAGYLETIGIPYVGSKVLGSALGQDKVVMKQVMESYNIPTPDYVWFYDNEYLNDQEKILKSIKKIGYPVIIKPASQGSSVGIAVAKSEKEIDKYIMDAIKYDAKIIVEKIVPNLMEVNCSVFGNYEYQETSAIDEMLTDNDFLTFEDKYIGGSNSKGTAKKTGKVSASDRVIPARISKKLQEKVESLAKQTFCALNLSGIARVDFLINKETEEVYVNEPNTIPGSLAFYLWNAVGKKYGILLDDAIKLAIKDFKNKSKKTTTFDSNILSTFNGSKGLKGSKKL